MRACRNVAKARDVAHGQPWGSLGRRGHRTAASPPACARGGGTSDGGGGGGVVLPHGRGRRRVCDTRGTVRRRTRRRLPGGHGPVNEEVGLQKVSDAGGS